MSAPQSTPRPRVTDELLAALAHGVRPGVTPDVNEIDAFVLDLRDARAELAALREEKAARADEDELTDALSKMMGNLLTQTANALKGEPPPLTLHDWSDLPAKVAALRERHEKAVAVLRVLAEAVERRHARRDAMMEPIPLDGSFTGFPDDGDAAMEAALPPVRGVLAAETAAEKQP